ncbi:MAG TPA: RagB/SusD family nutrient uptake outer membrane protein, partial [Bacteroidaceae bacterium]|nr:RagB/SusD family nutrient uptake outer membrane protein [Bacteroidaceae bacterium]
EGDLRADLGSYVTPESIQDLDISREVSSNAFNMITKFTLMTTTTSKAIAVYRARLLYLRYAEAVNRAGKPNLAFAVLKNGLNSTTLAVDTIVPRAEKYREFNATTGTFYDYVNFEDIVFNNNIGVHAGGCGNVRFSTDYIIPALASLQDSILFVEDKVIEELALETAFEGNRFHDLIRIAFRRNDPAYLSNRVAEKYTDNKEAIRTKLMDENNWYLR